ncbi:hypothetical protein ACOSP7_016174 [Xanthoceras sorbifolium]
MLCKDILQSHEFEELAVILWRIWFRRNKFCHYQILLPDDFVCRWSRSFFADFHAARNHLPLPSPSRSVWIPPAEGFYKINCDAAVDVSNFRIGLGVIIRDCFGRVMLSSSCPV